MARYNMEKQQTFFKKALLLILSNLMTGVLGFTFSVILSRLIGPEGMGLFSLIFPINFLLLSVITGGLMIAVSKVIAEYNTKREGQNIRKTIKATLTFNLILSLSLVLIVYLLSYQIAVYVIKDPRTLYGLRLVLFSTVFMSLSNTYKGYFFGTMKVAIPAIVDIFEKLIRIILLLIAFKLYDFPTTTDLVTVTFLIFGIGELSSLIFFFVYYHYDIKKYKLMSDKPADSNRHLLRKILIISIPLMFTELISSSLYTVSSLIIPRRLVAAGIPYVTSLEMIGKFTGMAMQIIFFPMIIIGSVTALLVPDLAKNLSTNDMPKVIYRTKSVINLALQVGLGVTLIGLLFGHVLGEMIYKQNDLGPYIRFLAYCAPVVYLSSITRGILNGLGKQNVLLKNTILLSIIQSVMLYTLIAIPSINIYGFGITMFTTSLIAIIINIRVIKRTIPIKFISIPKNNEKMVLQLER